jgi:hypothetical protein
VPGSVIMHTGGPSDPTLIKSVSGRVRSVTLVNAGAGHRQTSTLSPVRRSSAAWVVGTLLLGGCGGSSSGDGTAAKQITIPAYNVYPAVTIPVRSGTPARCRRDAEAFSRRAVGFLAPFPSDSDTHLVIARVQFLDFKAHRCDPAILRSEFSRQATRKQRQAIVARSEFSFLGETGRELTGP